MREHPGVSNIPMIRSTKFCSCCPEFDLYLQDIIDISSKYKGNVFYQYHKAFAMKVATIKLTRGLAVD
jgi:hypothetical protein